MKKFSFSNIMLMLGLVFLYIPLVILVLFSFSDSEIINLWGGFTFNWYHEAIHDTDIINATITSLKIATITAVISTFLGTIVAYAITRFHFFRSRSFLYGLVATPLVLPDIILGVAFLLMFSALGQFIGWPTERGTTTVVIAHVTMCTAYVTIVMQSRIASVDISLEEAALDLGAGPIKTFFSVMIPQLLPALITSALLTFTLSIDDLVVTEFVAGSDNPTLPMYIYSTVKNGPTPEINALATIMIAIIVIGVLAAMLISSRFKRK
ncbi:ABC transporter permease [Francisella adeliensis]|uniref:ABC transporter permease n=1 Tax=Francisella adeliensis TaxID=2007306 RepID=A0A2Z4Y0F0_9GAMM|nr:ABC transporter permease [Francisella adeliensis]AXA34105.1 putrescine ABC transporter permease PotI [Francisella adeliensis]MBK2085273.1 ABC transporter permease [Francisella adeliensis]MBK2095959.1 ABC transporter permease [Francisella adeliensis]QIW12347.1 ABC transporter permease [Francisella adeliensis]QIW14221.1 ABC transporter permease [Francisella adeliensis]